MPRLAALIGVLASVAMSLPSSASAQRRKPTGPAAPADQISVSIEARVAGKTYQGSGPGECRHADEASIHGVSAALWMVQYDGSKDGSLKRLNLTLWRPKDASPDQLSLVVETKSGSHRIQTGAADNNAGEGSVTILPSGPGGRLEVSGKEAEGKPLQITIECSGFGDVASEGG